jgi:hypothetical protein
LKKIKAKALAEKEEKLAGVDKSFFIDIKVAQPPTPKSPLAPIQHQQQQSSPQISNITTANTSIDQSPVSLKTSVSQNKITTPIKLNDNQEPPSTPPANIINKITPRSESKPQLRDYNQSPVTVCFFVDIYFFNSKYFR